MTTLPPVLAEIAEGAGLPAALALGRDKAAQRIYVPHAAPAGHWLADLVGLDAAAWICQRYGGDYLIIPPALAGQARQRRETIARMTDAGHKVDAIASSIGIDRRTVQRHRGRRREKAPLPLFDGST